MVHTIMHKSYIPSGLQDSGISLVSEGGMSNGRPLDVPLDK